MSDYPSDQWNPSSDPPDYYAKLASIAREEYDTQSDSDSGSDKETDDVFTDRDFDNTEDGETLWDAEEGHGEPQDELGHHDGVGDHDEWPQLLSSPASTNQRDATPIPSLPTTPGRNFRPVYCERCGAGPLYLTPNSNHHLIVHQASRKCRMEVERAAQKREAAATAAALATALGCTISASDVPRALSRAVTEEPRDPSATRGRNETPRRTISEATIGAAITPNKQRQPERSISPPQYHRSSSLPAAFEGAEDNRDDDDDVDEVDLAQPRPCPGVALKWDVGEIYGNYPWMLHSPETRMQLGYRLDHFEGPEGEEAWLRSTTCTRVAGWDGAECAACRAVSVGAVLRKLEARATSAPAHILYTYLTPNQLVSNIRYTKEEHNKEKLKYLSVAKKASRTAARLSDYKRLVMALATNDVKRVNQLIAVALRRRVSAKEIIRRIEDAARDLYHVRGFTSVDLDLATLMKRLSGRKGSYALSHSKGMPSTSSIRRHRNRPKFLPSISFPKANEIGRNITTFFGEGSHSATLAKAGHSFMIDGLHLDQRPRLLRSSNQIIGFCREHTEGRDLAMGDMDSVLGLVDAVHGDDPSIHYGREATVGAIGAFRSDHYHGVAVMQTQSCKAEKGDGFARILRLGISQWREHGEPLNGPLFVVGTDGDAVYRDGCFKVLMTHEVESSSELYQLLGGLVGLNLECGEHYIVHCPDPKHLVKRIGTLHRSVEGVVVDQTIVNRELLTQWLRHLPNETEESVRILVDPADHQNVPRSVKLVRAIGLLGQSPNKNVPSKHEQAATQPLTNHRFHFASMTIN